jgi:uncharacterized protein YndB with AHSA1/START domain
MMSRPQPRRGFTCSVTINAPCEAILGAFFDPVSLARWWHVTRSLCVPRVLGCYAIEWGPTERRDEVLGRLGGVFHGTVMTYDAQHELFVADGYWMAPDGDPIGPLAFEVTCSGASEGSIVAVRMSGADTSDRWDRYYAAVNEGLDVSMARLKTMLEDERGS